MSEKLPDREMIAASETARRNPMRPPEHLPRDAATALRVYAGHPSTLLIAAFVVFFGGWRLALGDFGLGDALLALAILAYFPVNEWLIHVVMLHWKPRTVLGRTVDFYLPQTHRRHHASGTGAQEVAELGIDLLFEKALNPGLLPRPEVRIEHPLRLIPLECLLEEPLLDGGERRGARHQSLVGLDRRCRARHRRQLGYRLMFENLSRGEMQTSPLGS